MPYIPEVDRYHVPLPRFSEINTAGKLNYLLSRICSLYLKQAGVCYLTLHDVVGVLRDVATEIERRFVGPYEDSKRKQNGEVFHEIVEAKKVKR